MYPLVNTRLVFLFIQSQRAQKDLLVVRLITGVVDVSLTSKVMFAGVVKNCLSLVESTI